MNTKHQLTDCLPTTAHADRRISQRGISTKALELVRIYGTDTPAGNACVRRELRLGQVAELTEEGFGLETIERAFRLEAIISHDESLITCYQRAPRRASRAARRSRRPESQGRRSRSV